MQGGVDKRKNKGEKNVCVWGGGRDSLRRGNWNDNIVGPTFGESFIPINWKLLAEKKNI